MTIQLNIHSQMTIQLTIYIVKLLYNSNDYTIDYIHSQMTIQLTIYILTNDYTIDYIHSQMTIQLTIYIVK